MPKLPRNAMIFMQEKGEPDQSSSPEKRKVIS